MSKPDEDEMLKIIMDASTLARADVIAKPHKQIIINVANLAMSQINEVINARQNEAERKTILDTITENFENSSKEEVIKHLNKVVVGVITISRAGFELGKARDLSDKMFDDEETKEEDMQKQENKEADLCTALIDEIKAVYNKAPEEADSPEKEETTENKEDTQPK